MYNWTDHPSIFLSACPRKSCAVCWNRNDGQTDWRVCSFLCRLPAAWFVLLLRSSTDNRLCAACSFPLFCCSNLWSCCSYSSVLFPVGFKPIMLVWQYNHQMQTLLGETCLFVSGVLHIWTHLCRQRQEATKTDSNTGREAAREVKVEEKL